jgi:hypothetical protein
VIAAGFRIVCLALVLVASPASSETIKNAAYRFTLNKPDGWHDMSGPGFAEAAKPVASETPAQIRQAAKGLVVAFSKLKEPTDELNSTFTIFAVDVGAAARNVQPAQVLRGSLDYVMKTGAKAVVLSPPRDTKLGGLPAAHTRVAFEGTYAGRPYRCESDMWTVVRGDSILIIQIQAKRADKKAGMDKLRAAVKSIRFER